MTRGNTGEGLKRNLKQMELYCVDISKQQGWSESERLRETKEKEKENKVSVVSHEDFSLVAHHVT